MNCSIMSHFIRVFTVCKSTCLVIVSIMINVIKLELMVILSRGYKTLYMHEIYPAHKC